MNIYQYTCAHSTSYQIMEQNSRITLWTKSYNSLELIEFSQHHTIHRVTANLKSSTNTWDKYLNQVLASYRITPNLAMTETPFFLVYGRDPNLPLHQLLEPMQCFLWDPESGMLNLETHRLALAIAKKTLDENRFKTAKRQWQETNQPYK